MTERLADDQRREAAELGSRTGIGEVGQAHKSDQPVNDSFADLVVWVGQDGGVSAQYSTVRSGVSSPRAHDGTAGGGKPPSVVLERVTYANEETGYTIARVATDRSGSDLHCAKDCGDPDAADDRILGTVEHRCQGYLPGFEPGEQVGAGSAGLEPLASASRRCWVLMCGTGGVVRLVLLGHHALIAAQRAYYALANAQFVVQRLANTRRRSG